MATDPYPVEVTAGLDPATGVVTWRMRSIDPATGELPEDPLAGFLPPNNPQREGEGLVMFRVRPLAGLANGAAFYNQARIVFDENEPIDTNVVTNTIDLLPPSSSVAALPASSPASFTVSWSGGDAGGSGLAHYDVYVSTNGGAYVIWQEAVTTTQAVFSGVNGATYGFYSLATDGLGHREAARAAPDAVTTVGGPVVYRVLLPVVMRP